MNNGVRLTKADMQPGSTPFVGASEANNGITMFTGSSNDSMDSNVLGVNYNGSIGYSFYHPYAALFSDDVKRVKWKDFQHNNTYTLLSCHLLFADRQLNSPMDINSIHEEWQDRKSYCR